MNKILENLYFSWTNEDAKEIPARSKAIAELCENKSNLTAIDKESILSEAVIDEKMNAFEAGFKTAVQLLMGGGQA